MIHPVLLSEDHSEGMMIDQHPSVYATRSFRGPALSSDALRKYNDAVQKLTNAI